MIFHIIPDMILQASNFVEDVDFAFYFIYGICAVILIALTFIMIYFVVKYSRKKHPKAVQISGNNKLEIIWTVIPLILVMLMFYYGYVAYMKMRDCPDDALVVNVVAKKWTWEFQYSSGKISNKLHVPVNKPVKLEMKSLDVIHSLYIPAFRVKEDIIPGRNDCWLWFIPQIEGTYDLFCTEYCGLEHSGMISSVLVTPEPEFITWMVDLSEQKAMDNNPGWKVVSETGCNACHSSDGTVRIAPSFKGLMGNEEIVITDGVERSVVVDDGFIKQSILDPNKDITKGFNKGIMISYEGRLTDEQIGLIINYIKSLEKE